MAHDQGRVHELARSYTEAWCSHDPARVAEHFTPGGTIAINGGEPTEIAEVARSFMSAFPDIQVYLDDVVVRNESVEYHWTFTGTSTGPGGTGKRVRISGFEEWTLGDDGLVAESKGNYDQAEYDRQLAHGAPAAITVIVELRAKPGRRDELEALLESIVASEGPSQRGFLGSTRYEVLDDPDTLVEIAEWESAEARTAHLQESAATGVYAPLNELLATPFRATVVRQRP